MAHVLCSNCVHLVGSDECISPVPELLRANKAPSSTEADAIKKFLVDVDSELHYLESILPKLTARRDHLKSVADSHRPLLSPALRIFPELLSEIFSWSPGAPTQDRSVNLPDNFDPRHGPLLLTQICRSWRKTAIATPKLWSTIRFVLGTRDKSKLIDMWLERSRDFDLTIAILDRSRSDHEAVRVRDLAFNAKTIHHLASRAHRWKSVFLQLPPYASYKVYWHALSGAKGNIGRLQQLSVHITRGQWQVAMPNIFTGGPQLTSLTLNHLISVDTFPIAGSRITEFRYENSARSGDASAYVPISECIKALRRFPNLERCHLDCSLHSNTDIANITMAKLERLTIRSLERLSLTLNPGELWQALHLPNLKILNVGCNNTQGQFHMHCRTLGDLISRCPMLATLALAFASARPQELVEVLQKAPNVRHLSLMLERDPSLALFSSITKPTTSASQPAGMLPRLKTIRFTVPADVISCLSVDLLFPTWVPMVVSRMDAATRSTVVDSGYNLLESAILDLQSLDSLGPGAVSALQSLRDRLDHSGWKRWDRIVSVGAAPLQVGSGPGSPYTAFSIRRRRRRSPT